MPRYEYHCGNCELDSTIQHLSSETVEECPECHYEGALCKKISNFRTSPDSKWVKKKIGETTEQFIKNAREELKQQKDDLDDKR